MGEDISTPVELKINNEQLLSDWARYTVYKLYEALNGFMIDINGPLFRSIQTELVKSGGDVEAVLLKFLQYGRFVDMGVGRGVPIGSAGSGAFSAARNADGKLKAYRRKPKHWYSKTWYAEVQKLKDLFVKEFGKDIPVAIHDALTVDIQLNA